MALLVAAADGVAMAFQGTLNAMLGTAGLWETTFISSVSGSETDPWYSCLGGFIGVLSINRGAVVTLSSHYT